MTNFAINELSFLQAVKVIKWFAVSFFILAVSSCSPSAKSIKGSVSLTDCANRDVVLSAPAQRIALVRGRDLFTLSLLLGADITNRVVAIGDDVRTVDMDIYEQLSSAFPSLKSIPRIGSVYKNGISIERLMEQEPDLVVLDTFMIDRGYNIVADVERAGLTAVFVDLSGDPLTGPQQSLKILGKALGRENRSKEITDFLDMQIKPLLQRIDRISDIEPPSVYIEAGYTGPSSYGPTYGIHENRKLSSWGRIVDAAGGRNIARSRVSGMAPIRPETLLMEDPSIIIISGAHWASVSDSMRLGYGTTLPEARNRLYGFTQRPGWDRLSALRNHRVYSVYHPWCMNACAFAALQYCAEWFYPDLFSYLEPDSNLDDFHKRFSPIPYHGTFIVDKFD